MKFKVGDRFYIKPYNDVTDHIWISEETWENIRKAGKVTVEGDTSAGRYCCMTGYCGHWHIDSSAFILNDNKIVITRDGSTTLARLYEGDKVIKSAEAKCSPSDTYDFTIGVNLAYDRLMGRTATVIEQSADPVQDKPQYREVKRAAKVGEKIKIVGNAQPGCGSKYKIGDVLTVEHIADIPGAVYAKAEGVKTDSCKHPGCARIWTAEYAVLEPLFDRNTHNPIWLSRKHQRSDHTAQSVPCENNDGGNAMNTFTKADLKTGMTVINRSGGKYRVDIESDRIIGIDGYRGNDDLCHYADDLTNKDVGNDSLDIVSVSGIHWQRPKRITKAEIEAELGYEVEIVPEGTP